MNNMENPLMQSLVTLDPLDSSSVGVVIPTLNEGENLDSLLTKLQSLGYSNVLVIDGKSTDKTVDIAKNRGVKFVVQKDKGKGSAMREVLENNYLDVNALVFMDADGSMDPEEIPAFIESLDSGADLVKGSRFLKGGSTYDMSFLRKIGNKFFIFLVNRFFSTKYSDLCYGFLVFNNRCAKVMAPFLESKHFEIETEILIKAKKLGLKVSEVPSTEFERKNGDSNLNTFRDGFKILKTIFKEKF